MRDDVRFIVEEYSWAGIVRIPAKLRKSRCRIGVVGHWLSRVNNVWERWPVVSRPWIPTPVSATLADMVVLSQDITMIPEEEILDTEVLHTIVGGRVLYTSGR